MLVEQAEGDGVDLLAAETEEARKRDEGLLRYAQFLFSKNSPFLKVKGASAKTMVIRKVSSDIEVYCAVYSYTFAGLPEV